MDEIKLNTLLLQTFPELTERFEEYTSWQDGMETGCFLTFEDLLLPLIRKAFKEGDTDFLDRACPFIEQLITSGDGYAENVATVGILEGVKATENAAVVRSFLGPMSLEIFDDPTF